jgi:hypothetical protein
MTHLLEKVSAKRSAARKALAVSSVLACGFAVYACGPAGDVREEAPSTTPDESVGTVSQALDPNWARGPILTASNRTLDIGSATLEVCVLTKVTGEFKSLSDRVQVKVVNGKWHLIAAGTAHGTAHCFRRSAFITAGTAAEVVNDPKFGLAFTGSSDTCAQRTDNVNLGDAVSYLAEVSGFLGSMGESLTSSQGISRDHPNKLTITNCNQGDDLFLAIEGRTSTFYAGPPRFTVPMPPAQFMGRTAQGTFVKGRFDVAGTFTANAPGISVPTSVSVPMVPANDAMCHLTQIAGEFDGLGEAVWIDTATVNGVETWRLNAMTDTNRCGAPTCPFKRGVKAQARCYLRDQRTACTPAQSLACGQFNCGCASGQCSGGLCPGRGCEQAEINACKAFGCGCSASRCSGGACP